MAQYGKDKETGEIYEFPDHYTENDIRMFFVEKRASKPGSQLARTAVQGLTFGTGEEIEAAIRSVIPGENREYSEIRDELRTKLKAYAKENPGKAITAELAGGMMTGLVGLGRTLMTQGLKQAVKVGLGEGLLAGYGYSDEETLSGQAADTVAGGATGAVMGPALQKAGQAGSFLVGKFNRWVAEKFGNRANDAVQKELSRLVEKTGKSEEQVLQELASGQRIAENSTLALAIKSYVLEGGESGKLALHNAQKAAMTRKMDAKDAMQESLAPGVDQNVMRAWKATDDEAKKLEREAYDRLFKQENPFVPNDIATLMQDFIQRSPESADALQSIYAKTKIVPLFTKRDNGAIELLRQPTLQDAEILRRRLRDQARSMTHNEGKPDVGIATDEMRFELQNALDGFSSDLKGVRTQAHQVREARDAFAEGRKALNTNVDELEMMVESMEGKPELLKALRAGFMDNLRQKMRKNKMTLTRLAEEETQFGDVLRTIAPDEDIDDLVRKLDLAGQTHEVARIAPAAAGSPTEGLRREGARSGAGGAVSDVLSATQGNPVAVIGLAARMMDKAAPKLTDQQRKRVVELIYSDNPDLVRRALEDDYAYRQLAEMVEEAAGRLGFATQQTAVQQGSQFSADVTHTD